MANLSFQYPIALWLLAAIPFFLLLYILYAGWKSRTARKIGDKRLVAEMTKNHSVAKSRIKFFLFLLAFAAGCVAVANPRVAGEGDDEVRTGIDLVFAVDISNSMLASDVQPTRLQAARDVMLNIIAKRPNDRISLVVFAGHAYVQLPLTYDHSAARMFINNLDPGQVRSQGTVIGEALEKIKEVFMVSSGRYKAVLLLTDGETHDEEALKFAEELANAGVMISSIGLGSPEGTTIYDPVNKAIKKDQLGNPVVSKLNELLLQQIAALGKGNYVHYRTSEGSAGAVLQQLSTIRGRGLVDKSLLNYNSLYMWLVIPMFVLLLVDFFLSNRKKIRA